MKHLSLVVALSAILLFSLICNGKSMFICDAVDMSPLQAASIINSKGELIGLSDRNGYIDIPSYSLPLTVSYQGYDKEVIELPSDTIKLTAPVITLPELVVGRDKTGVRLICLADEITTNISDEDTIIVKARYIVDFLLPFKDRPKGFKQQEKARIINKQSDAVKRTKAGSEKINVDDLLILPAISFVGLRSGSLILPEEISDNAVASKRIKVGDRTVNLRRRDNRIILSSDKLENEENHVYSPGFAKLLGLSMDITRLENTISYYYHPGEIDRAFDFIGASFGFGGTLRGKMFKKMLGIKDDMSFQSSVEIKLLECQFITNEESRQLRKNPGSYPFPK